jgi:lipopolysaccharide transport system ATP-binding protein
MSYEPSSANGTVSLEKPETVIEAESLGKCYRMYEKPVHRLMHRFTGKSAANEFWALRGVDLEIRRGETFGIIGRNGSGKSTLLQMIAGTLTPTEGRLSVRGRVAALLELGSGFNPEFTGRENVYLNAAILGLSRSEVDARFDDIVAFAEIGDFVDQPVRSYSSGMTVRLAFAVIAHVDADVLIIDEALSVGDTFFSQKCMRFLREFQKNGTLLFVSHDSAAVINLCERALLLENGKPQMIGAARDVVEAYTAHQHAKEVAGVRVRPVAGEAQGGRRSLREEQDVRQADAGARFRAFEFDPERAGVEFGAGGAKIRSVSIAEESGSGELIAGGEVVVLRIIVELHDTLRDLIVGFYVKDRLGQRLFGDNTYLACSDIDFSGSAGDVFEVSFRFRMPILPYGAYTIDAAVASGTQHEHVQQHWVHDALEFRALDQTMRFGLIGIPMLAIDVNQVPS